MYIFLIFSLTIFIFFINHDPTFAKNIISSPVLKGFENLGEWGPWDKCLHDEYTKYIQLKIQQFKENRDDTGVNVIKFKCGKSGSQIYSKDITSTKGSSGTWGKELPCDGFLTGFQVQTQQNKSKDCIGVVNVRVFCSGSQGKIEGEGVTLYNNKENLKWTKKQTCSANQAICGIQTQVHSPTSGDKCGITNVKMECCNIKEDACTHPTDEWVLLVECDNLEGMIPIKCKFKKKKGTTTSKKESSKSNDNTSMNATMDNMFGFGNINSDNIFALFKNQLSVSKTTGHEWAKETVSTFLEESIHEVEFEVPPNVKTQLKQIVGSCGYITVYTGIYKKFDSMADDLEPKIKTMKEDEFGKEFIKEFEGYGEEVGKMDHSMWK